MTASGAAARVTAARPAAACAMAVMGKASTPGRAKTRLVPPLTAEQAAQLNTAFLQDSVGNVIAAGRRADLAVYTAFSPTGSEPFFRQHLPPEVQLIECSFSNFGDCLYHALTMQLELGHSSACVLNADSPSLPIDRLVAAAAALEPPGERIVLGPSEDGGYYFLGLKQVHRRLFDEIDWSTSRVCPQTCDRAMELKLPIVWLDPWYDVDDAPSLARLQSDLERQPAGAAYTRAALRLMQRTIS